MLAALFVINAAYFFDHRPLGFEGVKWLHEGAPDHPEGIVRFVEAVTYVLPTDFVLGVLWQVWHNRAGHNAGLLGMYSRTGWWYYFPVAFALKTTLPFLLLSLASLGWGVVRAYPRARAALPVSCSPPSPSTPRPSSAGALNLGVRYFLPGYMLPLHRWAARCSNGCGGRSVRAARAPSWPPRCSRGCASRRRAPTPTT